MTRGAAPAHGGTTGGPFRHVLLFATLYGGYGSLSPFLPNVLAARGLTPAQIGLVLAAATLVRLVAGPLAGRLADGRDAARRILAGATVASGLAALAHLAGHGFAAMLGIGLAYAVATAPLAPLADALALAAARGGAAFRYGGVRAAGSAAFIGATGLVGWTVEAVGLAVPLLAAGALFLAAGAMAARLPVAGTPASAGEAPAMGFRDGFLALVRIGRFRRTVLAAGLIVGAHALHEAFAMILWRGAGIGAGAAGMLWSEAVAAEVVVFLAVGPPLLARIGTGGGVALAALAGAVRWAAMASTVAVPWLAMVQLLHGLSFALLHLACLGLIEESVPGRLRATALTLYGSVGLGLAGAAVTLVSGSLFANFGAAGFWAMAALSLSALALAPGLRSRGARGEHI